MDGLFSGISTRVECASESNHENARIRLHQGLGRLAITRLSVPICGERILRNLDGILRFTGSANGADSLAAASLGFIVLLFIRSGSFGLRIAGQALVAQRVGANDSEGASIMAGQTISLVGVFSLITAILGFWLAPF